MTGLWFDGQKHFADTLSAEHEEKQLPIFDDTVKWLNIYFQGKDPANQTGIPRMSAQAVGGAVGHNSISLIIPCHRVVGTNGSLTGYAGGIDKKVELLKLEGVNVEKLWIPSAGTAL